MEAKETELTKQCYAVADYFAAASDYKISLELGREGEAKQCQEEMKKLEQEIPDLDDIIEDIRDGLDIE